jgi:hypothetical protein
MVAAQTSPINHHLKENTMHAIHAAPLLTFAFAADAAVSAAVALLQLLFPDELSRLLLLPRILLVDSGIFLVGYALLLALLARARSVARPLVLFLIVGNAAWAAGCALVAAWNAPSALGVGFVAIQAFTVLLFAGLQWAGMKASPSIPMGAGARQSA